MKLSVIIVNYNVRYFLEQALRSVSNAIVNIPSEVFVVDNNSVDDSVQMVREKFPEVKVISNKSNPGFSIANNQAIKISKGEYVLLLNPDTLVEEDTFSRCIEFMDTHPDTGALGVKMIDGSGRFLPESKRGFPSPFVAFCKTFGLSSIFPKSKLFNRYHLGHLDEDQNWEVDILAGAYMMLRKKTLDEVGLLDEQFFMYGEDIDLSYRIQKAGYKNYYFSDTTIIHYKGESTKKGDLNYVKTFYKAMILFSKKHFTGPLAGIFVVFLNLAIYFRAGLSIVKNLFKRVHFVLFDAITIFLGIYLIKDFWANYFYNDPTYFNESLMQFNAPLYTLIWLIVLFFNGAYDKPFQLGRLGRGLLFGLVAIAGVYGFLNTDYRSSRAIILLTTIWTLFFTVAYRYIIYYLRTNSLNLIQGMKNNVAIVGSLSESNKVQQVLNNAFVRKNIIGVVSTDSNENNSKAIDNINNLEEVVQIFNINEVIFCAKDISSQKIISSMTNLGSDIDYKILPIESLSIIGSSTKDNPGELYTVDVKFNINDVLAKRNKRLIDVLLSTTFLVFIPLMILMIPKRTNFIKNIFNVLFGKRSWIGYNKGDSANLPILKEGVLYNNIAFTDAKLNERALYQLNFVYAKDYTIYKDLSILWNNLRKLGN